MDKLVTVLGGILLVGLILTLGALVGPLVGAFVGWVLSWAMPTWISGGFAAFGLNVNPDQFVAVGAMLGFVGAFLRSTGQSNKS